MCEYSCSQTSDTESEDDTQLYLKEENKDTFVQNPESCMQSVQFWGPSIRYVRDEFITYELCRAAVEDHDGAICSIKPELLTEEEYYELCWIALSENGFNLRDLPPSIQTQELCDVAIESSCWALEHCSDKFKTRENCMSAVSRNGQTLAYIPREFIDAAMCLAAVSTSFKCMEHVPAEFVTRELCERAVRSNGENIAHVPDAFMSSTLGLVAIQSPGTHFESTSGRYIKHIPAKFLTKEIVLEAVRRCPFAYRDIPASFIDDDIENAVLDVAPYCIAFMTQTPEKCMRALQADPSVIDDGDAICRTKITREMAAYILSRTPNVGSECMEWLRGKIES